MISKKIIIMVALLLVASTITASAAYAIDDSTVIGRILQRLFGGLLFGVPGECVADVDMRCNALNNQNVDLCDSTGQWDTGSGTGFPYCDSGYGCSDVVAECDAFLVDTPCCILGYYCTDNILRCDPMDETKMEICSSNSWDYYDTCEAGRYCVDETPGDSIVNCEDYPTQTTTTIPISSCDASKSGHSRCMPGSNSIIEECRLPAGGTLYDWVYDPFHGIGQDCTQHPTCEQPCECWQYSVDYATCQHVTGTTLPTTTIPPECNYPDERCIKGGQAYTEVDYGTIQKCSVNGKWVLDTTCSGTYYVCEDQGVDAVCRYPEGQDIPDCRDEGTDYKLCGAGDVYNSICEGDVLYVCKYFNLGDPSYSYCWVKIITCSEGCVDNAQIGSYCKEDASTGWAYSSPAWYCYLWTINQNKAACEADTKCEWVGIGLGYCRPKTLGGGGGNGGGNGDGNGDGNGGTYPLDVMEFEDCESWIGMTLMDICGWVDLVPLAGKIVSPLCKELHKGYYNCLEQVCNNQKEACGEGVTCEAKYYICLARVELKKIEIEYGSTIMFMLIAIGVITMLILIKS